MTTVDNIADPLFAAFGATSVDLAGALQGNQENDANGVQEFLTNFAGYVENSAPWVSAANNLFNSQRTTAQQELASGLVAAPTDTSLLLDPTASDNKSVLVQPLHGMSIFFPSFNEGDPQNTALYGTQTTGDGLSVGFKATTQGLPNFAHALIASGATAGASTNTGTATTFSSLPTVPELANAQNLTQIRGAGHVLPVAELNTIHAATQITDASTVAVTNTAPAATGQPVATATAPNGAPIDTASIAQTTTAPTDAAADLDTFANEAIKQAETAQQTRQVNVQTQTEGRAAPANAENVADKNIDPDGQVVAVQQKSRENSFVANQQLQNQTAANQPAATQAAATAASVATPQSNPDGASTKPLPTTEKRDALNVAAPADASVSPRTNIDQVAPAARSAVDWSSPWSGTWTPERAAGWPEGFGTDLIAGGLSGLKGDGTGLLGMGLMGGKPNPALGGHIAKQLNVNVTRAVKAGDNEFSMRMDPPELGKVTVKLKFGADGSVRANVLAERPETLELLQRETRGLERAIEAGGSKTADGGISFSLDTSGEESAGKAFAEAMQEDRLKEAIKDGENGDGSMLDREPDGLTESIDLEEILAHVTPDTGIDVRV